MMSVLSRAIAELRTRLRAMFRHQRVEADIQEEIRYHLERRTADLIHEGLTRDEARREAERRFGNVQATTLRLQHLSSISPTPSRGRSVMLDQLYRNVAFALRSLRRAPGFTAVAVITLALGIGANTAIFSVVDGVLLRPLHFPDPDEIVLVYETDRARATTSEGTSAPDYVDWLDQITAFEQLAAIRPFNRVLTGESEAERLATSRVTANYFPMLGVQPALGRLFRPDEEGLDAERVVLLSHSLWRRRFGSDPDVVGQTVHLDGMPSTVIGVMPPAAQLTAQNPTHLWEPLRLNETEQNERGMHVLVVVGRLADDVDVARAQAEMTTIMASLEAEYPAQNVNRGARVVRLHEQLVGNVRSALVLLLGAVGLVLLIACANVANLLLARGASRERDLAVRTAIGAGRNRLIVELLTESMVLAAAGGIAGVGITFASLKTMVVTGSASVPRLAEATIDGRVLLFTIGVSLLTGLLFGLLPALKTSRPDLQDALKEGSRGSTSGQHPLRQAFVVAQLALAVILVIGAGLLIRSFWTLQRVDPGYDPQHVLAMQFDLPNSRYEFPQSWPWLEWPEATTLFSELTDRIGRMAGVESVALGLNGPHAGGWTTGVAVVGAPPVPPELRDEAYFRPVSASYFSAMRIPMRQGREFTQRDITQAPLVAVINESFKRQYFPETDPIGERVVVFGVEREIVGVSGDVAFRGLATGSGSTVYLPLGQNPMASATLLVRGTADPEPLLRSVQSEMAGLDPDLAFYNVTTLEAALSGSVALQRFSMLLLVAFAGVALTLAAVGIYGVLSYVVAQRRHELGIRMALGAARGRLVGMVLRQGMLVAAVGVVVGLVGAYAATRLMGSLLFGVGTSDPITYSAVPLVLAGVALVACYLPARRASQIDPMSALRNE